MKKIKKNQKGFTLVELLVVCGMISILFAAILSMIPSVGNLFRDTSNYQYERQVTENLMFGIEENVRYADDVIIITNCTDYPTNAAGSVKYDDYSVLCLSNATFAYKKGSVQGRVFQKETLASPEKMLFNEGFYGEYSYRISTSATSYDLTTTVKMYKLDKAANDDHALTNKSTIKLLNLDLNKITIKMIDANSASPVIPSDLIVPAGKINGNTYILYHKP